MKCPHCLTAFHDISQQHVIGEDSTSHWTLYKRTCPTCAKFILTLKEGHDKFIVGGVAAYADSRVHFVYPTSMSRTALPPAVPAEFASDYKEACETLSVSPKASAALSRRCLQHILREKAGIKKGSLAEEIQQVIDSGQVPGHVSDSLDAVRHIGNFAAHPTKSKATGEILEVEAGEAEWNLDVIEALYEFYFIQPAIQQQKKEALNKKLAEAGKPLLGQ
jgi:hypothetical protein